MALSELLLLLVVFASVSSLLVRRLLVIRDEVARERTVARRLGLLNELLWEANATYPDLDRLMPTVAHLTCRALGGHLATTALFLGQEGRVAAWATESLSRSAAERLASSLVVKDAIELRDAAVVWDAASDSRCTDPVFAALDIRSCLAAPLFDDAGVFGAVLVAALLPNQFTGAHVELAMAMASHAALPIRNARLHSLEHEHATRLAQLERAKRDFLTIASHELQTPLAAVKLSQDVLAAQLGAKLSRDELLLVTNVDRNIRRLERLVGDFLLLARLQCGSVELHREPADLGEAIQMAVADIRGDLEHKRQQVVVTSRKRVIVSVDPRRLRKTLGCLLSNASKFSSTETTITLGVKVKSRELVVSVTDQGIGIPADQRERIFQPFVRLSAGSCEGRGAGLGLPIARALVELHGGRLWVEDGPKGGSTFAFSLPCRAESEVAR